MKRLIHIDELVKDSLQYEKHVPGISLLIGTVSENGEYFIGHVAETLEENKLNELDDPSSIDDTQLNPDRDLDSQPKSFTAVKLATISHHTKQVIRMLPGGLQVLGFGIVEEIENIFSPKYDGILKSLCTVMNKSLERNPYYGVDASNKKSGSSKVERVILHYNPATKKFNIRSVDCSNFKMTAFEAVFESLDWKKIECEYDTLYGMHLSKGEMGLPLRRNIKVIMDTVYNTLNSAKFIINGCFPNEEDIYEEPTTGIEIGFKDLDDDIQFDHSESSNGAGGGSGSSSPRHHSSDSGNESESDNPLCRPMSPVHILINKAPSLIQPVVTGQDFIGHIHLHGKISAVAFVPSGSSTKWAAQMLQQDIMRSLASRIEMHCESLIEEEQGTGIQSPTEEGCTKVYHEVPRRVFARLLGSKLLVSDYLFPGEGPIDSLTSFREILSLNLEDESNIVMTKEKPFNLDDLRSKGSLEELICKVDPIPLKLERSNMIGLALGIGLLAVCLAILVSYLS